MSVVEYPHPVLQEDGDDYGDGCTFSIILDADDQHVDAEDIVLSVGYELECPGLEEMIEDGRAIAAVQIHSPQASYRKSARFEGTSHRCKIQVSKFDAVGKLEVRCLILANQDIRRFSLPDFNQLLFDGALFDLRKGNILAISEKTTVYLDSTDLEKPLTSIFIINLRDSQTTPIEPDFSDATGKIAINLQGSIFNKYRDIQSGYAHTAQRCITCAIVLPVLTEAIDLLRNDVDEGEFADLRWAQVILHKLDKKGIEPAETYGQSARIANDLLGDVIGDSLEEMVNILCANDDVDEDAGGKD